MVVLFFRWNGWIGFALGPKHFLVKFTDRSTVVPLEFTASPNKRLSIPRFFDKLGRQHLRDRLSPLRVVFESRKILSRTKEAFE
jgi:hypothetical protein